MATTIMAQRTCSVMLIIRYVSSLFTLRSSGVDSFFSLLLEAFLLPPLPRDSMSPLLSGFFGLFAFGGLGSFFAGGGFTDGGFGGGFGGGGGSFASGFLSGGFLTGGGGAAGG